MKGYRSRKMAEILTLLNFTVGSCTYIYDRDCRYELGRMKLMTTLDPEDPAAEEVSPGCKGLADIRNFSTNT